MGMIHFSETIYIPEGVSIKVHAKVIEVEGPRGKLIRDFKHLKLNLDFHLITDEDGKRKLKIDASWFGSRKATVVIRTTIGNVENVIKFRLCSLSNQL